MCKSRAVNTRDSILLFDPNYRQFSEVMDKMKRILTTANPARERREFIIYFSGHSDEEGLLLGRERYSYAIPRKEITGLPTEVLIALLDSCSSGALTWSKGVVRRPAFLLDASNVMKRYAFLTSSSAEETAQESDALKAFYFSHYLISGL